MAGVPRLIVITSGRGSAEAMRLVWRICQPGFIQAQGWPSTLAMKVGILIREPELERMDLAVLAIEARKLCATAGIQVLVSRDGEASLISDADGLHLPESCSYQRVIGKLLGRSCHSRAALLKAQEEGCDYALLSPFAAPRSHSGSLPALGAEGFGQAVEGLRIPVLALGGMTPANAETAIAAGAWGVAAITGF